MTTDKTPQRGRNIGHILQGMLFVWLITFLAIPAILLLSGREARGDRLFGAWIMLAIQAVFVVILLSFLRAPE